jgi:hypothetical protein
MSRNEGSDSHNYPFRGYSQSMCCDREFSEFSLYVKVKLYRSRHLPSHMRGVSKPPAKC